VGIPKDLKVGETFTDDGREYIVLEIVAGGYISSADPELVKTAKSKGGRPRKEKSNGND
jgi:hypothetical protein